MDLRNQVKHVLRMCGHAMVSTIHGRLDAMERALQEILDQNTHIATTQTALLQSNIHLVERIASLHAKLDETSRTFTQLQSDVSGAHESRGRISQRMAIPALHEEIQDLAQQVLESAAANLRTLQETGASAVQSGVQQMLDLSNAMRESTARSMAVLEPVAHETREFLTNETVRQVCVETADYLFTNPELGLIEFLYPYLPSRTVLDVGAHVGDVSEHLVKTGYEVYAFEPYAPSHQLLTKRLGTHPEFHSFNIALGSGTGELPLYLAQDKSLDQQHEDPTVFHSMARHSLFGDLAFHGMVPVAMRRLADLHRDGVVPSNAGLVKIDTEGYDLEVIRGMDDYRYPVVMVEFWDANIPFAAHGLLYTAETMTSEMRQRGYSWYIVIYRLWGRNQTGFFCNHDRPVPGSWGNILFFRDRELFMLAQQWCSAVLPRTYFKRVLEAPLKTDGQQAT